VRTLVACYNAGDYPRVLALFSDDFLRRGLAAGALLQPAAFDVLEQPPAPEPDEWRERLPTVRDVRVLADGRVGAVVGGPTAIVDPGCRVEGDEFPVFVIFVAADGGWLIDEAVTLLPAALSIEEEGMVDVVPFDWRTGQPWPGLVDAVVDLRSAFSELQDEGQTVREFDPADFPATPAP
jgi:hypothetical protein